MNRVSIFGTFSLISIAVPVGIIIKTVQKERNFLDMVMHLTSSKLNLVLFLNSLVVIIANAANLLVWGFFGSVRTVDSKYLLDKSQTKIFQFGKPTDSGGWKKVTATVDSGSTESVTNEEELDDGIVVGSG